MNARRDTARRWVIDDRKTDEEIAFLILRGYDEGPARIEMEGYVNEARAEANQARAETRWWDDLEKAYRACGYRPKMDSVAFKLKIPSKTLRRQCRDHGITDWRSLHARFG